MCKVFYLKDIFDTKYFIVSHVYMLNSFKELAIENLSGFKKLTAGHSSSNKALEEMFNEGKCIIDTADCSATSDAWAAIQNLAETDKIILRDSADPSVDFLFRENRKKEDGIPKNIIPLKPFSDFMGLISNLKELKPKNDYGEVNYYGLFEDINDGNAMTAACVLALLIRLDCTFHFDGKWSDIFKLISRHISTIYNVHTDDGYFFKEFYYCMNNGFHTVKMDEEGLLQFPGLAKMTISQSSKYTYIVPKLLFEQDLTAFPQVEKLFSVCRQDIMSYCNRPKPKKLLEEVSI